METKPQPIFGIESINVSAENRAAPTMVSIATTLAKIVAASAGDGAEVAVSRTFVLDGQSYNEVVGACLPEIAIIINRLKARNGAWARLCHEYSSFDHLDPVLPFYGQGCHAGVDH